MNLKLGIPKLGLPVLPLLGGIMLSVGPFLIWLTQGRRVPPLQGLEWSPSAPFYVFGALVLVLTLLSWENERRFSAALIVIGAASLALVFHFVYVVFDRSAGWGNVREGFYVSGVGAALTTLSGCPLFRRLTI